MPVPDKIDVETQQKFIDGHEDLRNSLGPDEWELARRLPAPRIRADPKRRAI